MSKALITSRLYTNLFRPESTSYLTGNAGDIIECEIQYEVSIDSLSSYSNTNTVSGGDRIERAVGSWFDDGYAVGQSINISWDTIPTTGPTVTTAYTADIKTLTPTIMIVENVLDFPAATPTFLATGVFPSQTSTYQFTGYSIFSTSPVEGIEFDYGLVTNTQTSSGTVSSLIDGSTTSFINNGLDATVLTPTALIPRGERSGASILSATIQGRGVVTSVQKFQINLKYILTPLWESITDVQTPTLPSFYDDKECVADSFKIKMLPQSGNPNISVSTSSSEVKLLGNTGFFEENYNGNINSYSIDSYSLFNSGVPTTGVNTSIQTNFTIVINDPNFTSPDKYKMGFVWTPDDDSLFHNNYYYNHENLMYNGLDDSTPLTPPITTATTYTGTPNKDGAQMDIEITNLTRSGNFVTLQGVFKPNAAFTTFMDAQSAGDKKYLIWVSVADDSLATNISDRVSLIVDSGDFTEVSFTFESWDVTNSFLEHPIPSQQVGVSFYEGCVEDEVLSRSIIKLDTSKQETIDEIKMTIEGYNAITQERFVLESNTYNTSSFLPDNSGIQQINIDTTRGFRMAAGVDKNEVKVFRSPVDDSGDIVAYRILYAFRMRWEDWIQNLAVPSVFWDNSEHNGLNEDWASKDNLPDWNLTYNVYSIIDRAGDKINTRNTFEFALKTYEESDVYDGAITTYDDTKSFSLFLGVDANGVRNNGLSSNANTWIEADFDLENPAGDVGDINDYYGVIRIEEYRNGGIFGIDMLSTALTNETTNNLLLPLTGEITCKITKVSLTKIRLECYLDYTKINTSISQYKISARLGCQTGINAGKYSSHYTLKYD
jgi:hypothetical protein